MKLLLVAAGSRGDVVPFGALAARLQSEGHSVQLLAPAPLIDAIPRQVPTVRVPSDPERLLTGPAATAVRRGDLRGLNRSRGEFAAFLSAFHQPTVDALVDADALVASTFAVAAVDAASERGVPVIRAHLWPESEDLAGPMPLLPFSWRLPRAVRRRARGAMRRLEPYLAGFDGGWVRGRLRLRPHHPAGFSTHTHGVLHAVSPALIPPPGVDGCATGWWWPPDEGALSARVTSAATGERTWISAGFGSMPQAHPEQLLADIGWAARRVGVRAFVQLRGAEGVDDGTVLGIGAEPHAALFERVALAVHHGGSGTTGAAVRAGIPSVVVPHFADQYYWGHRLYASGVAPRMLPRALLGRERLARAIETALSAPLRRRSAELGVRVRAEDGTGTATRFIVDSLAGPGDAVRGGAPSQSADKDQRPGRRER